MQPTGRPYPAAFRFDPPEQVANWRPLVNWLLAIPHLLIVTALRYVAQLLAVVCWFIILFTGRLPVELANFQVMYLRYDLRTSVFAGFLREEYPPFGFAMTPDDPGGDPRVRVDVAPQLEQRNRVSPGRGRRPGRDGGLPPRWGASTAEHGLARARGPDPHAHLRSPAGCPTGPTVA